ncbi:hemerythrin [Wenjunlia vitaminophila]|uniref:Hemerythrin n=1 Tax=Wenjunlia vitaminophila TaxID=76728 RepID=A0A0T6LX56_WENVI|nr:hemerythrin domain-containing protein [Wenjunlia vitaminophila]KRV50584.1 hemerythrin [Wenjunlia vitaminophila]
MAQTHSDVEDVVALLKDQHQQIREQFTRVETASGQERRERFGELVRLLAVHETAEEEVVHPAARRAFDQGKQVVNHRLEEEREAKRLLRDLENMNPDEPEFMAMFRRLRDAVLAHADAEERYEFEELRAHTEPKRLAMMAKAVRAAEATAPTHPHPGAEGAAKNMAMGPFASVMDRTRDTVRKVMERRKG